MHKLCYRPARPLCYFRKVQCNTLPHKAFTLNACHAKTRKTYHTMQRCRRTTITVSGNPPAPAECYRQTVLRLARGETIFRKWQAYTDIRPLYQTVATTSMALCQAECSHTRRGGVYRETFAGLRSRRNSASPSRIPFRKGGRHAGIATRL